MNEILSVPQAAKYMGCCDSTVREACRAGLPHRRVERRIFISRKAIDDWVSLRDGELFTADQVAERVAAARATERALLRDKIASAFGA
jgi:excisionase family DNA binding protein